MGLVARFRRPPEQDAAGRDEDDGTGWSPRARTVTVIGAALAAWAVAVAIIYLIGTAIYG